MLKPRDAQQHGAVGLQPPSGGCVLKLKRLKKRVMTKTQPPSGGCVLKLKYASMQSAPSIPAAFRRLCVETTGGLRMIWQTLPSRLQAAVC